MRRLEREETFTKRAGGEKTCYLKKSCKVKDKYDTKQFAWKKEQKHKVPH